MNLKTILPLVFCIAGSLPALSQGLKFTGLEQPIDKRTSYDVFGSSSPEFSGRLDIRFDMALYHESEIGYIFRIKNRSENKVYNLFYDGQGDRIVFMLNDEGYRCLIRAEMDAEAIGDLNWISTSVAFDMDSDSVFFSVADSTWSASVGGLPDRWKPDINFGRSDYIIDVPSFAIRNLVIGGKQEYRFAMEELSGNIVHDAKGRPVGKVTNPGWMMNDFYKWKHLCSMSSLEVSASAYDPERKVVYYFNRDSLHVYNVRSGDMSVSAFRNRCPVQMTLGMCFLDAVQGRLYAYEVWYENERMKDSASVACLDLETLRWSALSREQLPMQMHHHGGWFDQARSRYTIFGGFGNMHYNGTFYSFDLNSARWRTTPAVTGDIICPRYFTSMGYDSNTSTLYIYGGMGNESGEQAVGRRYLYDLYSVDMSTGNASKLWTTDLHSGNVVPVRGMYLDGAGSFYTLCYPESISKSALTLYKFSIKDGSFETLADTIPIMSDKITTNANLYYDSGMEKLYALVYESDDDITNSLSVYSLSLLPAPAQSAVSEERISAIGGGIVTIYIVAGMAAAAAIILLLTRKSRKKPSCPDEARIGAEEETPAEVDNDVRDVIARPEKAPRVRNSIYLFGGFTAIARDGKNITSNFSPMQQKLFCVVLYHTPSGGIATGRLSAMLWPDRQGESIKNLRNATLNHLRKSLSDLIGVNVVYKDGCYRIDTSGGFYCDYLRFKEITDLESISDSGMEELAGIFSNGRFMESMEDMSLDPIKENVGQMVMRSLPPVVRNLYEKKRYADVITFCESLYHIDPFNDFALKYYVSALCRMKRTDEALLRYSTFIVEYRKVYGENYPYRFEELLGTGPDTESS